VELDPSPSLLGVEMEERSCGAGQYVVKGERERERGGCGQLSVSALATWPRPMYIA